jgi:hypothetical protein
MKFKQIENPLAIDEELAFNFEGLPCFKYSPSLIADRGKDFRMWTTFRLRSEVLFLEHEDERYEISLQPRDRKSSSLSVDLYRFALLSPKVHLGDAHGSQSKLSIPLADKDLASVLYRDLDWKNLIWDQSSLVVKGRALTEEGEGVGEDEAMVCQIKRLYWMIRDDARKADDHHETIESDDADGTMDVEKKEKKGKEVKKDEKEESVAINANKGQS